MPGPARAGALLYAKDLQVLGSFYQELLTMQLLLGDAVHQVLENADFQLILHALAEPIARTLPIHVPPQAREQQAIKLFFTVPSLAHSERQVIALGGGLLGPIYDGPGFRVRNAFDPEGNIFHLRASNP